MEWHAKQTKIFQYKKKMCLKIYTKTASAGSIKYAYLSRIQYFTIALEIFQMLKYLLIKILTKKRSCY